MESKLQIYADSEGRVQLKGGVDSSYSVLRRFTSGIVLSSSVSDASLQTPDRVLLLRASLPFVGLLFRWAAADAAFRG